MAHNYTKEQKKTSEIYINLDKDSFINQLKAIEFATQKIFVRIPKSQLNPKTNNKNPPTPPHKIPEKKQKNPKKF